MLTLIISGDEYFNNDTQEFITTEPFVLEMEHSLLAVAKWEAKHQKPFLGPEDKSSEEMYDYIRFMFITPNVPDDIFKRFTSAAYSEISDYLGSSQTATTFYNLKKDTKKPEIVTSELIYYWLVALQIPFTCETWNLNRLFTLIRICDIKNNSKPKKMSRSELAAHNRAENARRKALMGTTG